MIALNKVIRPTLMVVLIAGAFSAHAANREVIHSVKGNGSVHSHAA